MDGKLLTTGGLSLVVGLLIGVALAPSDDDIRRMERALAEGLDGAAANFDAAMTEVSSDMGEAMTGVSDTVQALDTRLSDLSTRVEGVEAAIESTATAGAEATVARLDRIEARLDAAVQDLRAAIADSAGAQEASLRDALASLSLTPAETAAPEPETPAQTQTQAQTQAPDPTDMSAAETIEVVAGRLRVLGPNTARVFVMQTMPTEGTIHLRINAGDPQMLATGELLRVANCAIRLESVDTDKANFAHNC